MLRTRNEQILMIEKKCNPMLSREALEAIYDFGRNTYPASLAVEVGTGHAAGTIALSLGLMEAARDFMVITFERIEGGSRDRYGGRAKNIGIIRGNLEAFGVEKYVQPVFSDVAAAASEVPHEDIDILMIDADGRIDREFLLFYEQIREGGLIIIDDATGSFRIGPKKTKMFSVESRSTVEGKRGITALLCRHFVDAGLMEEVARRGPTRFFTKPENAPDRVDPMIVIDAYREVIPAPVVFGRNQKVMYLPPVVRLCKDLVKRVIRR